jgi:hypothetical protein
MMYSLLALLLAVEDHGALSVDRATGVREHMRPLYGWISLAAGLGGAALALSQRTQTGQSHMQEQQDPGEQMPSEHGTVEASHAEFHDPA